MILILNYVSSYRKKSIFHYFYIFLKIVWSPKTGAAEPQRHWRMPADSRARTHSNRSALTLLEDV